jgi:hypothetical protein
MVWNGGDFENGIWYSGVFEEKNAISRFGTMAIIAEPQFGSLDNGLVVASTLINIDENGVTNVIFTNMIWYTGTLV